MTGLNVLSLFDGMSCGRIALENAAIPVNQYFSSEVDKYAIQVSQENYPEIIQLGDIQNWKDWGIDLSKIDLVIGGSPCQGFSFSGRGLAFDDPRSKLFFTFADIVSEIKKLKPDVKFLLENVRMKKEYSDIISGYLKVDPIRINSALVSAQNRVRDYWANWKFIPPEDKGLVLSDIIIGDYIKISKKGVYKKDQHKASCLTGGGHSGGNHSDMDLIGQQMHHIGNATDIKGFDIIKRIYAQYGKSPTLTTMTGGHRHPKIALNDYNYRRLTPLECERLQTVPENYTNHVSNTQRYKMLGNGWTVDVITHILGELYND